MRLAHGAGGLAPYSRSHATSPTSSPITPAASISAGNVSESASRARSSGTTAEITVAVHVRGAGACRFR
ncbi:hypothetical protein [Nannocystis pusilla]|uniref:hypothetical protein n=1 Tax=Nannocystis pusilla TaxID=889268 RepID=UPI003B7A388D